MPPVGVCQRDSENYYDYIDKAADEILSGLTQFFNMNIKDKFPSADFVVDIYRKDSVCTNGCVIHRKK